MRFDEFVGQKRIKEYIQRVVSTGKLSHAYLFVGEKGSGKMQMAKMFAQRIQCEADSNELESCGVCKSCMQAMADSHPDIIYVTHDKAIISVDDIRNQVNNDVAVKPFSSQTKIYIIDEAEKMNVQAQNALLKTLEEPPEYVVIILVAASRDSLLQTILSRVTQVPFVPVPKEEIQDFLMSEKRVPSYVATSAAAYSGGVIGRAIDFATSEVFNTAKQEILDFLKKTDRMDAREVRAYVKTFAEKDNKKEMSEVFLKLSRLWFKDILYYKSTGDAKELSFVDEADSIKRSASERSFESLSDTIAAIQTAEDRLKANTNLEYVFELLIDKYYCG